MQEPRIVSVEENKGEKPELSKFQEELKTKLQTITQTLHKAFEKTWQSKKALDLHAIQLYRGIHNAKVNPLDLSLESMQNNLHQYQSITHIQNDFTELLKMWKLVYENKVDDAFYKGYQYVLKMLEAHFIEIFIRFMSEPLAIKDSTVDEGEVKVDINILAAEITRNYIQHQLNNILVKKACDDFKAQLIPEITALNEKIKRLNRKYEKLVTCDLSSVYEKKNDTTLKMAPLLLDEQAVVGELTKERAELVKLQDQLYEKNSETVNQFILKLSAEIKIPEPDIDFNVLDELKQKRERLKHIVDSEKENIERAYYKKPKQREAINILIKKLNLLFPDLQQYKKNNDHFYMTNQTRSMETYNALQASYELLCKSNVVRPSGNFRERARNDLDKLNLEKDKRQQELLNLEKQLTDTVNQALSSNVRVKLHAKIISERRRELIRELMKMETICIISSEQLKARRAELDRIRNATLVVPDAISSAAKPLVASKDQRPDLQAEGLPKECKTDRSSVPISPTMQPLQDKSLTPAQDNRFTSASVTTEPVREVSMLNRFLHRMHTIYDAIKGLFSRCIRYCCCCFMKDEIDNESAAVRLDSLESVVAGGSTATLPFAISTPKNDTPVQKQKNSNPTMSNTGYVAGNNLNLVRKNPGSR